MNQVRNKQKISYLEMRKMDIRSLMVEKFGGSVEIAGGKAFVRFHPTRPIAFIVCYEKLFFANENNTQESFAYWKWQKMNNFIGVRNLEWNVSVNHF